MSPDAPGAPPRAVVIEADPVQAGTWMDRLRRDGLDVHHGADEAEATRLLIPTCALALLSADVLGDALERTVRQVRTAGGLEAFVVCTASQMSFDRRRRLVEMGADDAAAIPADQALLEARLTRLVELIRTRREQPVPTDPLTRLPTHAQFRERLAAEFLRAHRYDDPLALLLVDLDRFRSVNEKLGRALGDELLRQAARLVGESVRETDLVARFGGEELAVILPHTHVPGSLSVAERIWQAIGTLRARGMSEPLTATVGVASYPHRSLFSADHLLRAADDALYRGKRAGGNRVSLYHHPSIFPDDAAHRG